MGFFWDQRQRLRRENWGSNAEGLSEELYGMFSPETPMDTQAPVTVSLPEGSTQAPYNIGNFTDGGDVFNIRGRAGEAIGSISISGGSFFFTSPGGTPTRMAGSGGGGGGGTVTVAALSVFANPTGSSGPGQSVQLDASLSFVGGKLAAVWG